MEALLKIQSSLFDSNLFIYSRSEGCLSTVYSLLILKKELYNPSVRQFTLLYLLLILSGQLDWVNQIIGLYEEHVDKHKYIERKCIILIEDAVNRW